MGDYLLPLLHHLSGGVVALAVLPNDETAVLHELEVGGIFCGSDGLYARFFGGEGNDGAELFPLVSSLISID